jgi:AcrR family transcriptional regulator
MTLTPWGDAAKLRNRRLSPGRGIPREEARRNQRGRLFAAMVAVTAAKGYHATSVADLVELSGVSSRSFYEHFADKEECFLATLDEIYTITQALAEAGLEEIGGPSRAQVAIEALVGMAVIQPATAKLCSVTAFCAGDGPRLRIKEAVEGLSALLQRGLDELPERTGMPPELTEAIFGGVALALYPRLAEDDVEGLPAFGERIRRWAISIPPPPGQLRAKARRGAAPAPCGPPPWAAQVPAERILRSFAGVIAEKGYAATTIADVAAHAHISQNTFYCHFRDKAAALEAALDSSGAQMLATVLPAVRREPRWPGVVRVLLEAACAFLLAEPAFAHLREVEVYAVGPEAVALRDRARAEIVRVLETTTEPPAAFDPVHVEAVLGALHSRLYGLVHYRRWDQLAEVPPVVTYLALAPELGAERAYAVACG